jgi:hypothetical protein
MGTTKSNHAETTWFETTPGGSLRDDCSAIEAALIYILKEPNDAFAV